MSWNSCAICDRKKVPAPEISEISSQKTTNYHEPSEHRQFRISIVHECSENQENALESDELQKIVDFFVDLKDLVGVCQSFAKFQNFPFLEISTNCTFTWISAPPSALESSGECRHEHRHPLNSRHFHAFLEAVCPSMYGIRPAPVNMSNMIPILDTLSHFHCEPLLTNCERVLISTNINQMDAPLLIRLLDRGLRVSLDHRILGRILCVCLMNTAKLADVSQELTGSVGSVFAQAFVANVTKSFRHVKPLEQENPLWPQVVRNLMGSQNSQNSPDDLAPKKSKNRKISQCDHSEESFECILCFDKRCGKCKGEAAFCYKAFDNFLYEVRLQLYPHTYRTHMDRDMLREDRINDHILRHQLQPLP